MSSDYVTIPDLTNLPSGLENADDMVIYDDSASDTKRVGLDVLSSFFSGGGGGTGISTEFILHTSAGAITPTESIVLVVVQANITLPSITDTPSIIAMIAAGGTHTVTCAASNYIYLVGSMPTSHSLANKEVLVLFSSDTSQNIWVPISSIADVSAI
jgi:hypothetical protein